LRCIDFARARNPHCAGINKGGSERLSAWPLLALPHPEVARTAKPYRADDMTIAAGGAEFGRVGSGPVMRYSAPATSTTAVTANASMARIRSFGSSICWRAHAATEWESGRGSHRLWLSSRALVVNNGGSGDLWLSATGAVLNGGR
jgi:hypothetical protein